MFLDSKMLERYVKAHEALAEAAAKQAKAMEAGNKLQKELLEFQKQQIATTAALEAQLLNLRDDN